MRNSTNGESVYWLRGRDLCKWQAVLLCCSIFMLAACRKNDHPHPSGKCDEFKSSGWNNKYEPQVTVFATGFNNPRGLKFGPDCHLYVAESGTGGTNSTMELCPDLQVSPEGGGPYLGSETGGRISKVNGKGQRTTVTENLPSTQNAFGDIVGVADLAFVGNNLYVLVGGGCSHGVTTFPTGILRVNWDGTNSVVADIGAWQVDHPVAVPGADFEPEGNPYSMVSVNNDFYVVESNQGQLIKATMNGNVSRTTDLSASQGHIVPTALVYHDGYFYLSNLSTFPLSEGTAKIYRIGMNGNVEIVGEGFTAVLGLAFDKKGRLYVLESSSQNGFPTPGAGRIVRVNKNGSRDIVTSGLSLPTGMTFGPDENLYVSHWGFGKEAGGGEILKVKLHD